MTMGGMNEKNMKDLHAILKQLRLCRKKYESLKY